MASEQHDGPTKGTPVVGGALGPTSALPVPKGSRQPLSREVIVEAAIAFVDHHGLSDLTMRRLGGQLGVEAMSLYRYVNGREDLLEGIVDRMVGELHLVPEDALEPTNGWQAYLQWLAHAVRALAREHPNVFPIIATRHPAAPWLRPPLRSLRVVENFFTALTSRGFSDSDAVNAYRAFSSFLLGDLLLEATVLGAETGPAEEPLDEGEAALPNKDQQVDLKEFPILERLEGQLTEDHAEAEFESSLEALLDRLDLQLAQ